VPLIRRGPDPKKLDPHLATALETATKGTSFGIIIQFAREAVGQKALRLGYPLRRRFRLVPCCSGIASSEEVVAWTRLPEVEMVWRDRLVRPCLDVSVPLVGAPAVWEAGGTGRGVRVAVVDTGVDVAHPDLAGRVIATHDVTGEGFGDGNGHGTHVAGIAAGAGERYRGVAPGAMLMAVKVLRSDGSGLMSWVMEGVEWALDNGAQVINLSLGATGPTDGRDPVSLACDGAVARGAVVCVAAGNTGPAGGTIGPPGGARQVVTVGAGTDLDQVADFSSRGPTTDGRPKPDLLCPGYGIVSCRAAGTRLGQPVDERYTEASGTSMATPHASGGAALLLEARPGLKPYQVKALLMLTARDLGQPRVAQGSGRMDVWAALQRDPGTLPQPQPEPYPWPPPGCLVPGVRRPASRGRRRRAA